MKKPDSLAEEESSKAGPVDLAQRLERYRGRVEAEGRRRSLKVIDRAIEDANKSSDVET